MPDDGRLIAATPYRFKTADGSSLLAKQANASSVEGMIDHYFDVGEMPRTEDLLHLNAVRSALPGSMIKAVRDRFTYRQVVPTHRGLRTFHRLVLPDGARVLAAEPEPSAVFQAGQQVVVLWSDLQRVAGEGGLPCSVTFRWDAGPPAFVSPKLVEERIAEFMASPARTKLDLPWEGKPVLVDLGTLGNVVSAEVALGLEQDDVPPAAGHLRFFLARNGEALVVSLWEVVPIPDEGILKREGSRREEYTYVYSYPEMGIRIAPPAGWQLTPLCRERTELQVLLESLTPPAILEEGTGRQFQVRAGIEVIGTYADKSEDQSKLLRRMTICSPRYAPAAPSVPVQRMVAGVNASGRTLLLEEGGGRFRVEKALLLTKERVRLLVRAYVSVDDRAGAELAFKAFEPELDSVLERLTFERPSRRTR
jgi:hypothetical protein